MPTHTRPLSEREEEILQAVYTYHYLTLSNLLK
jgi:hypothetical protein